MIVGYEELPGLAGRVTMVDGCFDPLHVGHLAYFRSAAALGRPLLANVQSDAYIRQAKGRSNLLPEAERVELIDALRDIAYVHLCTTSTLDVLGRLRPAVYAKGADWRDRLPGAQTALCAQQGTDIEYLDTMLGSSTRLVRRFLGDRERESASPYAAVVTSHRDPYLSGVAKFNRILAERLGVPCIPMSDVSGSDGPLLLSLKLTDAGEGDIAEAEAAIESLTRRSVDYDVFWHGYAGTPLERRVLGHARRAFAGNAEIAAACGPLKPTEALWCPGLLDTTAVLPEEGLRLLSFGMAHKVQLDRYARLRDSLDDAGVDYTLLVSTAFHEKASFGEIESVAAGFRELFGQRVRLLGFLSDTGVNDYLARSDAMVAFFPHGVRSNNTSVLGAMGAGKAVLTNLDSFSPPWMQHGRNVVDVDRVSGEDLKPGSLAAIGRRAAEDTERHAGWDALVSRLASANAVSAGPARGA